MKKFLLLLLALTLAMSCIFVFASCDSEKEKDEDEEVIPNEDPDEAREALEDAGYEVRDNTVNGVGIIFASKGEDTITITYCADEEAAETAYEELEKNYEEAERLADEAGEDFNYEIGISGNMIWAGTPDAIEDAQ